MSLRGKQCNGRLCVFNNGSYESSHGDHLAALSKLNDVQMADACKRMQSSLELAFSFDLRNISASSIGISFAVHLLMRQVSLHVAHVNFYALWSNNESIKGSEHSRHWPTSLKYERSHREFVGWHLIPCFAFMLHETNINTADENHIFNDSLPTHEKLCLISFIFCHAHRMYATKQHERARRSRRFHNVRNRQRISIFKL